MDEVFKLQQEVRSSFAYVVRGRLETLQVNYFVFSRNYSELMKLLKSVQVPEKTLDLWSLKNRDKLNIVINEVVRLFHNYLASAKTLVDHTRVLIRAWYRESDFLHEYEGQVNSRFTTNSLSGFFEGLRNYSLHYTLPLANASMKVNFKQGGKNASIDFTFVLHKVDLLYWSQWPSKARPFLDAAEDEISINEIVEEYFLIVERFHIWLYERLIQIHSKDLEWLEEMNVRILSLLSEEEKLARGLDT